METIEIKIRHKHFRTATRFVDNRNCPLAMALKDHFKIDDVNLCTEFATVADSEYKICGEWHQRTPGEMHHHNYSVNDLIKRAKQKKKVGTYTVTLIKK